MFRPTTTATAERITETNDNRGRTAPQHLLRKLKNSEILAKPRNIYENTTTETDAEGS